MFRSLAGMNWSKRSRAFKDLDRCGWAVRVRQLADIQRQFDSLREEIQEILG